MCVVALARPLKVFAATEEENKPGLVVVGVACAAKNKDWREGLVGFGVHDWVAQAFYDSGQFRMLEEKPEVLGSLQPQLEVTYETAVKGKTQDLDPVARALHADLIAVGRVRGMVSLPSGGNIGPISFRQRDTLVKLELCLFDVRTGKTTKAEGTGKVVRKSTGIIADFTGMLPFDPSTVGPATRAAVRQAVAKLVPGYQPKDPGDTLKLPRSLVLGVLPLALKPEVASQYPELKNKRVALGVHNRIVKTVKTTGQCELQEINPEILQALELQWWVGTTGAPPAEEVDSHTKALSGKLDWILYGEIFSFSVRQREKLSGLSGKVSSEVTVGVQLRAVDPRSKPLQYFVASGIGKETGDWETWKGSDIDFEQTFVGKAAGLAIEMAWPALLRDLAEHSPNR